MLIFYKNIDKSVLKEGFTIPIIYVDMIFENIGFTLAHGEKRIIDIIIDGEKFKAELKNINFDKEKYPNHKDLLQIRYGTNSRLAVKLRQVFSYTGQQIAENPDYNAKKLSEGEKEFIAIYSTPVTGEMLFDCITNGEFREESDELRSLGEVTAERILDGTDEGSGIVLKTKVCKIRRLNTTILSDLKSFYGYRCQICGQFIGEKYGTNLIHAHHIDYFTKSLNNNASNILILCPNHHCIIHDKNPIYNYRDKTFTYPNGYKEGLALKDHLK